MVVFPLTNLKLFKGEFLPTFRRRQKTRQQGFRDQEQLQRAFVLWEVNTENYTEEAMKDK